MAAINDDYSFRVSAVNGSWTRMQPNPADATIPKSGAAVKLQNMGNGIIYGIKRAHPGGSPSPALPAATQAGADGDAGQRFILYPQTEPFILEGGGWQGAVILSDYYVWSDDATDADNLLVVPIN